MKANVVLFSYNRPRMIRESLDSIFKYSTHKDFKVWLIDDGSEFDVLKLYEEYGGEKLIIAKGEKISLEDRISDGDRFVDNVNFIISMIARNEFIIYLCDDDMFGHEWLGFCSKFFELNPHEHVLVGDSYYFYDGENPYEKGRLGFKSFYPMRSNKDLIWWNVGNFAHRTECILDEGLRWRKRDGDPHSWDIDYIHDLNDIHISNVVLKLPALYRREHKNSLSVRIGRMDGDPMSEDSAYVLMPKPLDPKMVEGWME